MRLYHGRVIDFQATEVARMYLRDSSLVLWSTGLGKSHAAMCLAALLFEDDQIDQVLLLAEAAKVGEWQEDFAKWTDLSAATYMGPKRSKVLDDLPQVVVTTYETARNDAAHRRPGSTRALDSGPLTEALVGKRVLVVYDEMSAKLRHRSSGIYRHHEHLLKALRKAAHTRVIGLTATPIESSPENAFNQARIIAPGLLTVAEFEKRHIAARDPWGNVSRWMNIGESNRLGPGIPTLAETLAPILSIKAKSDPDVVDQFPEMVEEFSYVEQYPDERKFYLEAASMAAREKDLNPIEVSAALNTIRQMACHPAAILHSEGATAREIVERFGAEAIEALGCAKADRLIEYLRPIVAQGDQAVVFTFFGQSVLPILAQKFENEGWSVSTNHGALTQAQREEARTSFIEGKTSIFLSSDAGSRGINLPCASYVVNYELPLTHATYLQRINRIHRLGQGGARVTAQSFVTAGTVEEAIVGINIERNDFADMLVGDDVSEDVGHLTAQDRKALVEAAKANPHHRVDLDTYGRLSTSTGG